MVLEADKRGVALALLQEPYVGEGKRMKDYRGVRIFQDNSEETTKAAIAVFDPNINIIQYPQLTSPNIVVVGAQTDTWKITLVSFYFEPDKPISPYLEHLKKIWEKIGSRWFVIAGDANSKNTWWGETKTDTRGEEMMGFLDELELHILNTGDKPTFDTYRGGKRYSSRVDITACTADLLDRVDDWKIDETLTSADHNGILFNIYIQKSKGTTIIRTTRVYNTKKANWPVFHKKLNQFKKEENITQETIDNITNKHQLEKFIVEYTNTIKKACSETIPMKKNKEKVHLPWWSRELEQLKKEVVTRKNRIHRAAPVRRAMVVQEYLKKKEQYETAAKNAQIASWKEFCGKQDRESVWDGIYRVIGRTKKREEDLPLERNGKTLDAKDSARMLAETFYPKDSEQEENEDHKKTRVMAEEVNERNGENEPTDPPFTMTELLLATNSFNPKKAPGPEGFTADICVHVNNNDPRLTLKMYNKCLELHCFPEPWKVATVVVLRKPGKPNYATPKAYRPIGLLPVMGKIYEKMLMTRIKYHLIPKMSTRQYGFMPQRSTEDSLYDLMKYIRTNLDQKRIITLVSLDIEGAFDSAWWPKIRVRLAEENCPINLRKVIDSYLENRHVNVRYAGAEYRTKTEKGCVQGSIGGPILWNLLLDPLLKGLEERGEYAQAFADDVVLAFSGETALDIEIRANATLKYVRDWGVANKLKFAPGKTNAIVITRRTKYDNPRINMCGTAIEITNEFKLLGVTIDNKLTFNSHVRNVCAKAVAVYKQLSRAAKINWGLHPEVIRLIYTATVEPIILYAASVWAPAAAKICVRKRLSSVQRGFLQKICKAYRTVSLNSTLVLAGILPLDLRVHETASLYETKRGVCLPDLGGREIERRASAVEAPHPAEYISLEFQTLVDEEQLNANSEFDIKIFTDGSKIDGRVGAALSLWNSETETTAVKLSLPSYCTVYQAELLAIYEASERILKHNRQRFAVYSDSRAALQSVTGLRCLHPLAVKTRANIRTLCKQNKSLYLFWIKAHAGLEGNERADQLAKEAALKTKRKPNYDRCPISFVKRTIRMQSLDKWNERYKKGTTASVTKMFFPDAVEAYRIVNKMEITGVGTQIMTGHGGFSEYLNRFRCKESPSCICDPCCAETVPHLITECPVYAYVRFNMEQVIGMKIAVENIAKIMASKNRDIFMKYSKSIVEKVISRNRV